MSGERITAQFDSELPGITSGLPVEVRDSRGRVVGKGVGGLSVDVEPGLYLVSATLPMGETTDEVVALEEGDDKLITLHSDIRSGAAVLELADSTGAAFLADLPLQGSLVGCDEGIEVAERRGYWEFTPFAHDLRQGVPVATFETDSGIYYVSLPVSPQEGGLACRVTMAPSGREVIPVAGFPPQRALAWTLEQLIRTGAVLDTPDTVDRATMVLHDKYSDATAAALGGLTLERLGRLDARARWIKNLANFKWLPDGRILLAALRMRNQDSNERNHGLELLLEVATTRPLFTDAYALQIDLLRRWPDKHSWPKRRAALAQLQPRPSTVAWSMMTLTDKAQ